MLLMSLPTPITDVLVFKTSVTRPGDIRSLGKGLDAFGRWNFDLDDCDHILRVETSASAVPQIVTLLAARGFCCEELPD